MRSARAILVATATAMRLRSPSELATAIRSPSGPTTTIRRRSRLAVAISIPAALILALLAAAAAGAFASTAAARPAGSRTASRAARSPAPRARGRSATSSRQRSTTSTRPHPRTSTRASRLGTSCSAVGHIGDSTSVGMISPGYLPDPAQRLAAQYADVGVRHLWVDASGGRSIVETLPGQVNGYNVARAWITDGFHGCWVLALGTNDTANVSVGSSVGLTARIDEMMALAHGEPAMWVNTHTLLSSGPWSETNMESWNNALLAACARYPNMRIFNWAALDRPAFHVADGIHYTPAGYAIRAAAIAHALARAFPVTGPSSGCVVN